MNKSKRFAVLVVACALLMCSLVAIVVMAIADSPETIVVLTPYKKENFERFAANERYVNQALYLNGAEGTVTDNADLVINGQRSLSVSGGEQTNTVDIKYGWLNLVDGTYTLSLNVRPLNVHTLTVAVRKNYLTDGDEAFLARNALTVDNNTDGAAIKLTEEGTKIGNCQATLNNGVAALSVEFTVDKTDAFVYVQFDGTESTLVLDDIVAYNHETSKLVATKDIDENYDNVDKTQSVFHATHFWCNIGDMIWDTNPFNNTNSVLFNGVYYNPNGDNMFLGGLTADEWTTKGNSTYRYEIDVAVQNIQELVFTTLDNRGSGQTYSEITYRNGVWTVTSKGGITEFYAEKIGGLWHLSWNRLTSDIGKDEHYIYATGAENVMSSIWLDNFVVAHF